MSAHTPGPWHASPTNLGADFDIGAENCANVAVVIGPRNNGADEFKANANLIAAAPDLLAQLRIVTDLLAHFGGGGSQRVIDALAAIAKAEGRTNG